MDKFLSVFGVTVLAIAALIVLAAGAAGVVALWNAVL